MTKRSPKVSTAQRRTSWADAVSRSRPACSASSCRAAASCLTSVLVASTTRVNAQVQAALPAGRHLDMKRTATAVLLALSLLLAGACDGNQSGDSNPDNSTDEAPGSDASQAPS